MFERQFYINYGGPGGYWLAEDKTMIDSLTDACLKSYTRPHRQTKLKIDDITLTIRTDGIHVYSGPIRSLIPVAFDH